MARPRSASAQTKMLNAVREIVITEGVDACTIEEVARRSGVAKTTIYRHYGGLNELIFASVAAEVSQTEAPDTGSLREDLRLIQRHYVETASHKAFRELFVWMMARSVQDPDHAALFRKVRVQPHGPTMIALQRSIARGELASTTDLAMAMHVIQGPFVSKRLVDNTDFTEGEIDTMVDLALRALGVEPND